MTTPLHYQITREVPTHLAEWQLPPDWRWGGEGLWNLHRHYQEVVDALGRSLSLVSAPDPRHYDWLASEARHLAHRNHPLIPTTYHYWAPYRDAKRGPGYLRRWIAGESALSRFERLGRDDVPFALHLLRMTGAALASIHGAGQTHGALSPDNIWVTPTGRVWLIGWEWGVPLSDIPTGLAPWESGQVGPPEWEQSGWNPSIASDQWQLAALGFMALTGEYPDADAPPIALVRPDVPHAVAQVLDRALHARPEDRHHSAAAMLRAIDRLSGGRGASMFVSGATPAARLPGDSEEARLRWATGDDYEVIARLGQGTFGSVWRVRDLTLSREVALKMLHPHVAADDVAVRRFRREAQLAAGLAHPAIVPIYDWDASGGVVWYTMELAEGGSLSELIRTTGPRPPFEVALQIAQILEGLAAAHATGIIHRDLKPENILIDRYRRWRIADFGVAKIHGEDPLGTTGTPEFAAPEQLLGEPQGPAVDLFGAAAIAAFVLSGEPPFGSGEGRSILARQLAFEFDASPFPPAIATWLRKGLAPMAENRFEDASEMLRAWLLAVDSTIEEEARETLPWWRRILSSSDAEDR